MLTPKDLALRWLAALLLASVLGNALLLWSAVHYRDKQRLSGQALTGAVADAKACSAAVAGLSVIADARVKESAAARTAATKAAGKLRQRSDRTLSKAPAVPGNMCASMQVLGDDWLRERGQ